MSAHFTDEVLDSILETLFRTIETANVQTEFDADTPNLNVTLQDVSADQFIRHVQADSVVRRLTSDNFTTEIRPVGHEDRRNCVVLFCETPKSFSSEEFHELAKATVRVRSEHGVARANVRDNGVSYE